MVSAKKQSYETSHPGDIDAGYGKILSDYQYESDPEIHSDFFENLAFTIDDAVLKKIGNDLKELVDQDDESRQGWLRVNRDGIDYLGLGGDRVKNTVDYKPTDIYAPSLMTSGLQVANMLFSRFFPPNGFCQTEILGSVDEELEARSYRIKDGMEELTKNIMPEYKPDRKQGFVWMVFSGCIFVKPFIDRIRNKPAAPFIKPEDIILDARAASLSDCERITHRFYLSERVRDQYFGHGIWKKSFIETAEVDVTSPYYKANLKMGTQETDNDNDKNYCFDETLCYLNLDEYEGKYDVDTSQKFPYLVVRDHSSGTIVGIFRHWDEHDPLYKAKEYLIQHKFFPGFNAYGIGLFHLCLGLARAETDLLQQLIQSLRLSNAPSLLMATGLKSEKSQYNITPGGLTQFQTFDKTIGDSLMPAPFKDPSSMYLDLMSMISKAINDRAVTNQMKPEDIPSNVSTTTMMGIMSLMQIQESALLNDLYDSFRKEFQILFTLFGEWLPDIKYPFLVPGGEQVLMKTDFSPNIAIRPIVDPNQSSQTFQLITNEALLQLAQASPDLYNIRAIHKRMLMSMRIDNIDEIMAPEEEPPPAMDPVSEEMAAVRGEPIKAYKIQEHEAYIFIHQNKIMQLRAEQENNPDIDNSAAVAALESNIRDRKNFLYLLEIEHRIKKEIPEDPTQLDPKEQNKLAIDIAKSLEKKRLEFEKKNPPPIDPNQVMMEEVNVKREQVGVDQMRAEMHMNEIQSKMQLEHQKMMMEYELKQAESMREYEYKQAQIMVAQMKEQNEQKRIENEVVKLRIEEAKLRLLQREQDVKLQLGMQEIEAEDRKTASMMESKAYDTTLKYENDADKDVEYAKIQADREKAALDAEVKSYDATLDFNKEEVNPIQQKE